MMQIRSATRADVPLILSLIRELAEFEKLSHEVTATEADLHRTLFGNPRSAEVLIAEYSGEAAGFALFFHNFSTFIGKPGIYLEDLFVKPKFRRNGIGKALMAKLGELANERGCGRFEWSVLDWNEKAIEFYRTLGAKPMDEWTVFRITGENLKRLAAPHD